jgi:hypothetical protein
MKPLLSFFLCIVITTHSFSQSDLLVLKQRNQIIQTWVPGSFINFQFSSKQWLQGIIKYIRNDSIVMEQIALRQVPTQLGYPTTDTAKLGIMKLHVNEIYGIPKRNMRSGIIANGTLFQLGSAAYIFLNIFNSLIRGEQVFGPQNLPGLAIAAGVFIVGKILEATHKEYITLGKKYTMETIHTQ